MRTKNCYARMMNRPNGGYWRIVCAVVTLYASSSTALAQCASVDLEHRAWSALLARSVNAGRVDYAGLQRDGQDELTSYLASLSGACAEDYERWSRADRIAFWINAYNAFTVRLILNHYPLRSIRDIGWLPGAAFRETFIPFVGLRGGNISLDDIEHRVLRALFSEPRIHFALVCAARSCPSLREEAYTGAELERQLDDQGHRFLGDESKNRVDAVSRTLYLSPIFKWFRPDFETRRTLSAFVAPYLAAGAVNVADFTIDYLDYDWSLNE